VRGAAHVSPKQMAVLSVPWLHPRSDGGSGDFNDFFGMPIAFFGYCMRKISGLDDA